jgi:putative PIN family toxin of toxin-antitoxin system
MRVVLDTNILVAGLLNPYGAPASIVRLVAAGTLGLCFDARILAEYRDVLSRPRFGFAVEHVESLLSQIEACGSLATATPLGRRLPDPDDEPFLEIALAGRADFLVTGNSGHFPANCVQGMKVVTPREFVEGYAEGARV